MIIMLSR